MNGPDRVNIESADGKVDLVVAGGFAGDDPPTGFASAVIEKVTMVARTNKD